MRLSTDSPFAFLDVQAMGQECLKKRGRTTGSRFELVTRPRSGESFLVQRFEVVANAVAALGLTQLLQRL